MRMQVLLYHQLDPHRIPNFAKVKSRLEAGDFRSADTKKVADNLYRARLDRTNRILFSFARYEDRTVILVLEYIARHAYEKSRFLARGATIDENKLPNLEADSAEAAARDAEKLAYLNPRRPSFNLLDKVISFDDAQHEVFALTPPLIVIGSAGSGKTVLTLEKMKQATGSILYITRSAYLADRSRETYYGLNYENDGQDLSFLSYAEFIESIRVPDTREIAFADFARWFSRHRVATGLKDPYQLFEEINGVITGSSADCAWLSREAYTGLGIRQSIYAQEDRERVYDLFTKYAAHLKESRRHDVNVLSYQYQALAQPTWDFIVVDEVQDFTNVQMDLVLRTLKQPGNFILCGDSNQIVHPSFFSWSGLKRHFFTTERPLPLPTSQPSEFLGRHGRAGIRRIEGFHAKSDGSAPLDLMRVLNTNYRSSKHVTEVANRILRLKHARFRSVDKESNHLAKSNAVQDGAVLLLADEPALIRELDEKTHDSTHFAVIVLHAEQKAKARERFRTPLTFSIQEAKGLEYDNIILYDFISGDQDRFREITRDVDPEQVRQGELRFGRARDKSDKSLEIFKFHINAFYVAATRAVTNMYLVESAPQQRLFDLLGIELFSGRLDMEEQASSLADWQREAQKLARQGKDEQAEEIRTRILGIRKTPWQPLTRDGVRELTHRALRGGGKKAMLQLFEYAILSRDESRLSKLRSAAFRPARRPPEVALKALVGNYFTVYTFKRPDAVRGLVDRYGVDHRDRFNCTPLMLSARFGHAAAVAMLAEMKANLELVNSAGSTAFQIMLAEAWSTPRYAQRTVPSLCRPLMPASVSLMVESKLVKLDNRQAEFLFFNLLVALFPSRAADNATSFKLGLRAADLEEALKKLPPSLVPEYRTKRPYISQVLSRNEVDRDDAYNRRLFKRTSRGFYILNPGLRARVDDRWIEIYELLEPDTLFSAVSPTISPDMREIVQRTRAMYYHWAMAVFAGDDPGPPPF